MSRKTHNKIKGRKLITAINLSNYNAPLVVEEQGRKYTFWGNRNNYFKYIDECYLGSTTNAAIISSISTLIYGKGLDDVNSNDMDKITDLFKSKDLKLIAYDYKKYGKACFQVGYSSGHKEVIKVMHHPVSTISKGKKNKDGLTESYYYSSNWDTINSKVTTIPAFGTSRENVELVYIEGLVSLDKYYSDVPYQAGLQYAKMEEEISNFHINNIQNGFSPGILLNFNNGIPDTEELQREIEQDVLNKWGGTNNAGKIIMSFNNTQENAPTLEAVPLSDADKLYSQVSELAKEKIMVAHKITSPMLLGLGSTNGFASNADELQNSYILFNTTVIRPLQDDILDAINGVLEFNNWNEYDLYFTPLMPIEFTDEEAVTEDEKKEVEKETGVKMGEVDEFAILDHLAENAPDGYVIDLIEDAGDEVENVNYEALVNEFKLADVETDPTKKSSQDSKMYKVRYRYKKAVPSSDQRPFCRKVHSLSGQNKFFRKEDINFMSLKGVNKSHGHNGKAYSIWQWQGGVNCHDVWERVIFKKQLQENGKPYIGNPMQNIEKTLKQAPGVPAQNVNSKTANITRSDRGHHPNYKS